MFFNVGKSVVLLCHQTIRQNRKMLSDIEHIIIEDKKKSTTSWRWTQVLIFFVFVLAFLCHKVTHVLFSGQGHIPPYLIYMRLLMLVVRANRDTYCSMKSDRTGTRTQTPLELHQMLYHWAIRSSRVSQCDRIPHSVNTSYVPVRRLKQHLQWEQMIAYLSRI